MVIPDSLLPPTVERIGVIGRGTSSLRRKIEDRGTGRTRYRPVSLDWEEAKARRWDYFHPELGWLIDGFKRERDPTIDQIMADTSVTELPSEPQSSGDGVQRFSAESDLTN